MSWHKNTIQTSGCYKSLRVVNDIEILYPKFAFLVIKIFINAYKDGLKVCIFETYRSQGRQLDLFNKGHTKLKKDGMHHFGVAVDVVFRDKNNYPTWKSDNWDKLGQIGRDMGLFWGGGWTSFRDCPHFQLIPAVWEEQTKIISGDYPQYDYKIDTYLEKITPYYKKIQDDNYSEKSFQNMINCYMGLFDISKIIEAKPVEMSERILQHNKRKDNTKWKHLLNWLADVVQKIKNLKKE